MKREFILIAALLALVFCACDNASPVAGDPDSGTDSDSEQGEFCPHDIDPLDCESINSNDSCLRYVDIFAENTGDGKSWESALTDLQNAIDQARCCSLANEIDGQVWVKKGTIRAWKNSKYDSICLRPGVSAFGGFTGNENSPEERDLDNNETIIDGRSESDDNQGTLRVVTGSQDALLDGFSVTGAHVDDLDWPSNGGGIFAEDCKFNVQNCRIFNNHSFGIEILSGDLFLIDSRIDGNHGSGLSAISANIVIERCAFESNNHYYSDVFLGGGGVMALDGPLSIGDSEFYNNHAIYGGGAMCALHGCDIYNTVFYGNISKDRGGALMFSASPEGYNISNCTFINNSAKRGGAIDVYVDGFVAKECHFENNIATEYGGAIANEVGCSDAGDPEDPDYEKGDQCYCSGAFQPLIENSTFSGNIAPEGSAIANIGSSPIFTNTTIVGDDSFSSLIANIHALEECSFEEGWSDCSCAPAAKPLFQNSILKQNQDIFHNTLDSEAQLDFCNVSGGYPGTGNIDADPLFINAPNGDFHIQAGSPCIDAADGDAAPTTDMEGNPRVDDPATVDTGVGSITYADMGAYEYQP